MDLPDPSMPSTMKSLPGNSWSPYICIGMSIDNGMQEAKQCSDSALLAKYAKDCYRSQPPDHAIRVDSGDSFRKVTIWTVPSLESSKLRLQRGNQRIDVLLRVEQVRRDAITIEPVLRYDLQFDLVLLSHSFLKRAAADFIRQFVGEQR